MCNELANEPETPPAASMGKPRGREALLNRHPWLVFLLPFVVYMLAGTLEPGPPKNSEAAGWLAIPYQYYYYPAVYTFKLAVTMAAMLVVTPGYRKIPFKVSPLAVLVGVVGIVVWVGLCRFCLENRLLAPIGLGWFVGTGARSGYNPFEHLSGDGDAWAWIFLSVRFFGLVLVVPLIEEFFLRGFLMRFFIARDWWEVPIGTLTRTSLLVGLAYPVLTHPAELFAAVLWFSLVTWLMVRTKNLWDCVVAHAVTNLLLGIYVVTWNQWHLM
jgi:CAAX protease family protein